MEKQKNKRKKFSAYVDESGQDTKGFLFVVSILVLENEESGLANILGDIEKKSKKRNIKWNKSKYSFRREYIEKLAVLRELKGMIFFDIFHDSKEYIELTSFATAKAILKRAGKEDYKVSVFVDGLKRKEVDVFSRGLRDLRIRTRKIRGVKKDENNVYIRLVDALCGLVRDAKGGEKWAEDILEKLKKSRVITEL